jgi:hypothetical protein
MKKLTRFVMAVQFDVKVSQDIIGPKTTEDAIRRKAVEMGINPDTREKVAQLKNALISAILGEISTFLKTDEAQELYSPNRRIDVKKFEARPLFLPSVAKTVDEKLQYLYPQAYLQQEIMPKSFWDRLLSIIT